MAIAVPHGPGLRLVWAFRRRCLFNELTSETVALPEDWLKATVRSDVDGHGFLERRSDDGSVVRAWAHQFLQHHVIEQDGVREIHFVPKLEADKHFKARVLLQDAFASDRVMECSLSLGPSVTQTTLVCGAFARLQDGAALFWSLESLFSASGADKEKYAYGNWRKTRWKPSVRFVHNLGLPDTALRLAEARDASSRRGPVRLFSFAAVSTHALLALLVRWQRAETRHGQWAGAEAFCGATFRALTDKVGDTSVPVMLRQHPRWLPPWCTSGKTPVWLPVHAGRLDLEPLRRIDTERPDHALALAVLQLFETTDPLLEDVFKARFRLKGRAGPDRNCVVCACF